MDILEKINSKFGDKQALLTHDHPLERFLPIGALLKFDRLVSERNRLYGPVVSETKAIDELTDDIMRRDEQFSRYRTRMLYSRVREEVEIEFQKHEVAMNALKSKRDRMRRDLSQIQEAWNRVGNLIRSAEKYARGLGSIPTMHKAMDSPTGDPVKAVARAKIKIAELKQERAAINAAPWPSSIVKAKAVQDIEDAAQRGCPDVFGAIENNDSVKWPRIKLDQIIVGQTTAHVYGLDAFAMIAWLYRERLIEMTCAEIDARSDDPAALSQSQRDAKQADVAKRLLTAERELEAAIEAVGSGGAELREHDQDIRAVLGLADSAPPPEHWLS